MLTKWAIQGNFFKSTDGGWYMANEVDQLIEKKDKKIEKLENQLGKIYDYLSDMPVDIEDMIPDLYDDEDMEEDCDETE